MGTSVQLEKDSGMSSLEGSKGATPERKTNESTDGASADNADGFDDEPDESFGERLWGLTEMFPEPVRKVCGTATEVSSTVVKTLYQFSCNASWIFFTSSMILFAPVIFETERAQMEEMHRTQQKQVLLGPGSAGGLQSGNSGIPALPPMQSR